MSTMASQWAQLVAQMGAEGSNAIAQGFNAGNASANTNIKQQQQDQEKQQQYRQAQQWDMDTLQHLTQEGALFGDPHTGLVKETQYQPDTTGLNNGMPIATNIMRQMDPDRTVKFKDADGNQIQAELPTADQQRARAMQTLYQQRQAESAGTAAGAPQYPTTPEYNATAGLPPGATSIPQSSAVALSERTIPATYRYLGQTDAANTRAQSATDVANIHAATAKNLQDLNDAHFQAHEGDRNKWEAAKIANQQYLSTLTTGRAKMTQDATDARNFQDNFNRNVQLHSTLTKGILAEQQKQIAAQGLAETPDGEQFTDPFDGKAKTMNAAQRTILSTRLGASQKAAVDMQTTQRQLEGQRDSILARMGGGAASPAANTPAANTPAANTPPPGPKTTAPAARVRVKLSDGRTGTVAAGDFDSKTMTKLQ